MPIEWIKALLGGILIGTSVSLMLFWNGRVTGISGIINGALSKPKGDTAWRALFLLGLLTGGLFLYALSPQSFSGALDTPIWTVAVAGLLVGFGTIMGSGCTSGHGVCGLSRLSPRSIVATIAFMVAGIVAVALFKKIGIFL